MKGRILSFVAAALLTVAAGVIAQSSGGGLPSRPRFQAVTATTPRTNAVSPILTESAVAGVRWAETDQPADEKQWEITASGNQFRFSTNTDAGVLGTNFFNIDRTGTTVDGVTITGSTISLNGSASTPNTFQVLGVSSQVINNSARFYLSESDAPADEKAWDIFGNSGDFNFRTRTDADGAGVTWLAVSRTGTTVDSIAFSGTALTNTGVFFSQGSRAELENVAPIFQLDETDAGADERSYLIRTQAGQWALSTAADATPQAAANNAILIDRTGTTVDSIALAATSVTVNAENVATVISARKASPTTRTSTTTSTADPDLTFTLPAGSWEVTAFLLFDNITTGTQGYRYQVNFAGTFDPALVVRCIDARTSNLAAAVVGVQAMNSDTTVADSSTANLDIAEIRCYMRATVGGTLQVRWAQEASSANGTRLNNGSWLNAERVGS